MEVLTLSYIDTVCPRSVVQLGRIVIKSGLADNSSVEVLIFIHIDTVCSRRRIFRCCQIERIVIKPGLADNSSVKA